MIIWNENKMTAGWSILSKFHNELKYVSRFLISLPAALSCTLHKKLLYDFQSKTLLVEYRLVIRYIMLIVPPPRLFSTVYLQVYIILYTHTIMISFYKDINTTSTRKEYIFFYNNILYSIITNFFSSKSCCVNLYGLLVVYFVRGWFSTS